MTVSVIDIGNPELQNVLGYQCLPHLSAAQLAALRATSRSMRDLVDGPCHEAWAHVAPDFLPAASILSAWTSGAEWQTAIRGEWRSQQAVRSASLHRVAHAKATQAMWVVNPQGAPTCSYWLTLEEPEGMLQLLDADKPDGQPVKFGFAVFGTFFAFMGKDSLLRVVEAGHNQRGFLKPLYWHTVDPWTGQTLSSSLGNEWFSSPAHSSQNGLAQMYHPEVHQVVKLAPRNVVYISEADTLRIISECHVPMGHAQRAESSAELDSLAWSSDGRWLAASRLHWWDDSGDVHVFDAASGRCVQSLTFSATRLQMSWSSRLPLLLVCSQKARSSLYCHGPAQWWQGHGCQGGSALEGDSTLGYCPVRVICPSDGSVIKGPAALAANFYWHSKWTPCGRLVVADNRDSTPRMSDQTCICVMEPCSLKQIFQTHDWPGAISWASRGQAVFAYFPDQGVCVKFFMQDDTWQSVTLIADTRLQGCHMGTFSPSGTMLVLPAVEPNQPYLMHYELRSCCRHSIADCSFYAGIDNIRVAWVPHPIGWAPTYIFVDQPGDQDFAPLKLVDAKGHVVLGSWPAEVLKEWAGLDQGHCSAADASHVPVPPQLIWSPNGNHLAVQDHTDAFVMSFGPCPRT